MQNATRPDVDKLISGGRRRRRRRNVMRAAGAALAVVLIGGGAYAATQVDRSDVGTTPTGTSEPSGATAPTVLPADEGPGDLEPGTYRVLVGADATGAAIEADLTVEGPGWDSGNFPVVETGGIYGGLGVYKPAALAAGPGCNGDAPTPDLGESPRALADQLAQLPRSTVVQPVTATEAYFHDAFHLRLQITDDCPEGQGYRVAETPRGSRGISYSILPESVVMDFWVLDLDGVPVVVDSWHQNDASADLVDRIAKARDSITFVTSP